MGDANDPEVYTAAVVAILSDYSDEVQRAVVDPRTGIPARVKWLPLPAEIKAACEAVDGPRRRAREWDRATVAQLQERARIDGRAIPSAREVQAALARNGIKISIDTRVDSRNGQHHA